MKKEFMRGNSHVRLLKELAPDEEKLCTEDIGEVEEEIEKFKK